MPYTLPERRMSSLRNPPKNVRVTFDKLNGCAIEVIELVMSKNADYGDAWQKQGLPGVCTRLSDKLCRLENLSDGRQALIVSESIRDTLLDVVGYGLLALLYCKEVYDGLLDQVDPGLEPT